MSHINYYKLLLKQSNNVYIRKVNNNIVVAEKGVINLDVKRLEFTGLDKPSQFATLAPSQIFI